QHWLYDIDSLDAMSKAAELKPGDVVLEVGPVLGTLTEVLISDGAQVTAVEFDPELFRELQSEAGQFSHVYKTKLTLVNEDILKFDLSQMPQGYKVVANIPYYLTSNLVRRLLEAENQPSVIALLIQKEVAERIVAGPGQHSLLSISVQFYAEAELRELVPAELFTPPPKVDSQIIKIVPREKPLFPDVDTNKFFKIVRAGFSEKRKKLRSSLSGGLHMSKSDVDDWLQRAHITADARAQELALEQWHDLTVTR
ncbi:ribosomal RNA small subunit methyltransferase A, partial [Candidatus Saccharibacteria bacterium]|nr:ribosomal RNA small subunit methyltransferase A [Candidatus Saccharibacteria bacterium]